MRHYWSLDEVHLENTWLTIGTFDGVHLGHQEIARRLVAGAKADGATAVVLTFHPHPAVVLGKRKDPFYLTSTEERAILLGELGVEVVITHAFDKRVAATPAYDFVETLHRNLTIKRLLIGHDFALGRNRAGDLPALKRFGKELGYSVDVMPPVMLGETRVSSSQIRQALWEGDVGQAALLLGRPYQVSGEIVYGDGRGRSIGIPTANLKVWTERALPKAGVYVCRAGLNGKIWGAVTNVGVRPTFENQPTAPQVEAHLLDFEGEIYGQELQLEFLSRLRDERRFPNVPALVEQIRRDIDLARQALAV